MKAIFILCSFLCATSLLLALNGRSVTVKDLYDLKYSHPRFIEYFFQNQKQWIVVKGKSINLKEITPAQCEEFSSHAIKIIPAYLHPKSELYKNKEHNAAQATCITRTIDFGLAHPPAIVRVATDTIPNIMPAGFSRLYPQTRPI